MGRHGGGRLVSGHPKETPDAGWFHHAAVRRDPAGRPRSAYRGNTRRLRAPAPATAEPRPLAEPAPTWRSGPSEPPAAAPVAAAGGRKPRIKWTTEGEQLLERLWPTTTPPAEIRAAPGAIGIVANYQDVANKANRLGIRRPDSMMPRHLRDRLRSRPSPESTPPAADAEECPAYPAPPPMAKPEPVRPTPVAAIQGPVSADQETIIRWGAERGLDPHRLDLDAVNRKRHALGLAPFSPVARLNHAPHA